MDITKTMKQVEIRFWWPSLGIMYKKYVKNCDVCQRN